MCLTLRYMVGFGLWNIDNVYCDHLKNIRSLSPVFAAPFTQLHGWWHLLAGYATHLHIQLCIHRRQLFLDETVEFRTSWIGIEAVRPKKYLAKDSKVEKKSN